MQAVAAPTWTLSSLIDEIGTAVDDSSLEARVQGVKSVLETATRSGSQFLPQEFCRGANDGYARRLVHADPAGRFTLMAMVWEPGQGTPLHDHNGLWVVECIYEGECQVTDYALAGRSEGLHQFEVERVSNGSRGQAEFRIPPFEYHVVQNVSTRKSITLHVFGGVMDQCTIFEPVDGGYVQKDKPLTLTA